MPFHFTQNANNHGKPFKLSTFANNKGKAPGLTSLAETLPTELSSFAQNSGKWFYGRNAYKASSSVEKKCCTAHDGHGREGPDPTKCWPEGVAEIVLAARSRLYKGERGKPCDQDASFFSYNLLARSLGSRFRSSVTGEEIKKGFEYLKIPYQCHCDDYNNFETLLKCGYDDIRIWRPLWEGAENKKFCDAYWKALCIHHEYLEESKLKFRTSRREEQKAEVNRMIERLEQRQYYADGNEIQR